jgi:hypothetical protein
MELTLKFNQYHKGSSAKPGLSEAIFSNITTTTESFQQIAR